MDGDEYILDHEVYMERLDEAEPVDEGARSAPMDDLQTAEEKEEATRDFIDNLPWGQLKGKRKRRQLESQRQSKLRRGKKDAESSSVSYTHSTFGACFLPASNPGDVPYHRHRVGRRSIYIQSGIAIDRDGQDYSPGIPWGSRGRLALAALMDRGARSYTPEVEMPESVAGLMKELGLPIGGRDEKAFADQFVRVAASRLTVAYHHDDAPTETYKTDFVKDVAWWTGGTADQRRLIPAAIRLDPAFHAALQERRLPFDMRTYAALSGSPLALDIYLWLTQQADEMIRHQQKKRRHDWAVVQAIFAGATAERPARFKVRFRKAMEAVLSVYPDAKAYPNDDAVWVYASRPHVTQRRAKRLRKVHGKG